MSWEDAWQQGRTGWDAGQSSPLLQHLVASGELRGRHALVPGCGAGYDVVTLAESFEVATGQDLAPTARARFEEVRAQAGISPERALYLTGDFFHDDPGAPFDLVWDYTFLCAIDPSLRPRWAARMAEIIAPGGILAALIFPVLQDHPEREAERMAQGPPFPLRPADVEALIATDFTTRRLEPVPARLSHPGREGLEWLGLFVRR
ncbi:methyltransferase domain-containing protein [Lujinxingia litoralis]|nr:methyltransferase domain-containing protein [Lujinxingia litoralis]